MFFETWNAKAGDESAISDLPSRHQGPRPLVLLLHTMADQECARGGGVSHISAEKRLLASLYSQKCMKMQYFHQ